MKTLISILAIAVVFALSPVVARAAECTGQEQHSKHPDLRTANTALDPDCRMEVKTVGAKFVYKYKGKKYYFCDKEDMDKFKKEPGKYIR